MSAIDPKRYLEDVIARSALAGLHKITNDPGLSVVIGAICRDRFGKEMAALEGEEVKQLVDILNKIVDQND